MKKFGTKVLRLIEHARSLRGASTDVERKLWHHLHDRQLEGYKFRRQFPVCGYILDFACEELRLAVELDGGQHANETVQVYDEKRICRLQEAGWNILRFWNHDVVENSDGVLDSIARQLLQHERA